MLYSHVRFFFYFTWQNWIGSLHVAKRIVGPELERHLPTHSICKPKVSMIGDESAFSSKEKTN